MRVISRTSFAREIITVHTCAVAFPVLKFNMSILRESSACTTYLKEFNTVYTYFGSILSPLTCRGTTIRVRAQMPSTGRVGLNLCRLDGCLDF